MYTRTLHVYRSINETVSGRCLCADKDKVIPPATPLYQTAAINQIRCNGNIGSKSPSSTTITTTRHRNKLLQQAPPNFPSRVFFPFCLTFFLFFLFLFLSYFSVLVRVPLWQLPNSGVPFVRQDYVNVVCLIICIHVYLLKRYLKKRKKKRSYRLIFTAPETRFCLGQGLPPNSVRLAVITVNSLTNYTCLPLNFQIYWSIHKCAHSSMQLEPIF